MITRPNINVNTEKQWQILSKISDEFVKKYPEYSRIVLQLLFNRGITEKEGIEEFLNPEGLPPLTPPYKGGEFQIPPLYKGRLGGVKSIYDPFLFKDMEAAVDLVIKHIKEGNNIVVYGDYDADGVTASSVLFETIIILKGKVDVYIPDRVSEGYGLNKTAIDEIKNNGVKLIITVDNGIRNQEEIEYAKGLGIEIIVTDHHIPPHPTQPSPSQGEGLPDCLTINPMMEGEKYSFKYLAGVGVAFKLAQAIIKKSTLDVNDKIKLEERLLDLVAIGTIADCVCLLGENRILTRKGLEVLNNTNRIGLKALIEAAEIKNGKKLDSWNIGFQIAPRLNSAGRMDHANTAFELLTTKNIEEAKTISHWLNEKNYERQKTTEEIVDYIINEVENDIKVGQFGFIIIAVAPEYKKWNEGVVGLVAGKISDKYYRPAIVLTRSEEGLKGSGRSIEEFNIIEAIGECAEFLTKFGGHKQACGLSLAKENLEKFSEKIKKIAEEKLKAVDLKLKIEIEAEIELEEVNEALVGEIEKLSPFGEDNERPKFLSRDCVIADKISMGYDGQHIKLRLPIADCRLIVSAVGFGQAEKWKDLKIGDKIDIVYYIEMNEFNGRREVQLKIIDIKKYNANAAN